MKVPDKISTQLALWNPLNGSLVQNEGGVLRIQQKRFRNAAVFEFHAENLKFSLKSRGTEIRRIFSYLELDTSKFDRTVEENTWFRNVGYLWILLGLALPGNRIVIPFGAAFILGSYILRVRYSSYAGNSGNLIVFDGSEKERILAEIKKRRIPMLRKLLGSINYTNTAETEKKKFEFLKNEDAISDTEYDLYMAQVRDEVERFAR